MNRGKTLRTKLIFRREECEELLRKGIVICILRKTFSLPSDHIQQQPLSFEYNFRQQRCLECTQSVLRQYQVNMAGSEISVRQIGQILIIMRTRNLVLIRFGSYDNQEPREHFLESVFMGLQTINCGLHLILGSITPSSWIILELSPSHKLIKGPAEAYAAYLCLGSQR